MEAKIHGAIKKKLDAMEPFLSSPKRTIKSKISTKTEAAIKKKMEEAGDAAETGKKLLRLFLILNVIVYIASIIVFLVMAFQTCIQCLCGIVLGYYVLVVIFLSMFLYALWAIRGLYGGLRVIASLIVLLHGDGGLDKLRDKIKGKDAEFLKKWVLWWDSLNLVVDLVDRASPV